MAALLHIDDLRRLAVRPPFGEGAPPRTILIANWHQDSNGKLICQWTAFPRTA